MNSSIVRILAVTLFAAGSFTHPSAFAAASANQPNAVAMAGPGGPQTPIPICPRCGRGAGAN